MWLWREFRLSEENCDWKNLDEAFSKLLNGWNSRRSEFQMKVTGIDTLAPKVQKVTGEISGYGFMHLQLHVKLNGAKFEKASRLYIYFNNEQQPYELAFIKTVKEYEHYGPFSAYLCGIATILGSLQNVSMFTKSRNSVQSLNWEKFGADLGKVNRCYLFRDEARTVLSNLGLNFDNLLNSLKYDMSFMDLKNVSEIKSRISECLRKGNEKDPESVITSAGAWNSILQFTRSTIHLEGLCPIQALKVIQKSLTNKTIASGHSGRRLAATDRTTIFLIIGLILAALSVAAMTLRWFMLKSRHRATFSEVDIENPGRHF